MLVSQYIYTACGKDRNGAFSVFSKSKDITTEEAAEIREVMIYKIPSGLPNDPTPEQIEELFPKKFGYFFLSSGRVCIAQVCYVGLVYSDLDGRRGNYIIHAFAFNKTNDFSPYSYIEHASFKRMLTRKEWHDDPIPDELPQIEISESGNMLSSGDVSAFFDEDRKNKLRLLIEAVVNSSSENPVYFKDDHKNLKYWFKILSICLPKTMQNEVSFCSHFTNTLVPGNISTHIQVRINQPENSLFNYSQKAQNGHYVFEFLQNIFPETIKPGKYANTIVNLFASGIFEVVKFADNINTIMDTYSVNINEASALLNLYRADYSTFVNASEMFNAILIADHTNYETQTIANNILKKELPFKFNAEQKVSVYAFIYKNISDVDTRVKIIKKFVDNTEQFGISVDSAIAFRDDLKLKASFIFDNYLDYLKAEGFVNYITRNQNSFPKLFLVFDFLVNLPEVKKSLQMGNSDYSDELNTIKKIIELVFMKESISNIDILVNLANLQIKDLGLELLYLIVQDKIDSGDHITNIQFSFDILKRLKPCPNYAYVYLFKLIKNISNQDEFSSAYINAQDDDPSFYLLFEEKNKQEPLIADFCRKKDILHFSKQTLTHEIIRGYFDKYYITKLDTNIFPKRLNEYLYNIQAENRINECFNILNVLNLPTNADKNHLLVIYVIIFEAIFSVSFEIIYDYSKKQEYFDRINEIYNIIVNGGGTLEPDIQELIIILNCGNVLKKYDTTKGIQIYPFFKESQTDAKDLVLNFGMINSSQSINTFISFYFWQVANLLIVGATGAKQFNYDDVVKKVFGKIIDKGDIEIITKSIITAINNSKTNTSVFVLYMFRKLLTNSGNMIDKKFGTIAESYLEKLSSRERKKTFTELLNSAESMEIEQFNNYFVEFDKNHKKGLFEFLKRK